MQYESIIFDPNEINNSTAQHTATRDISILTHGLWKITGVKVQNSQSVVKTIYPYPDDGGGIFRDGHPPQVTHAEILDLQDVYGGNFGFNLSVDAEDSQTGLSKVEANFLLMDGVNNEPLVITKYFDYSSNAFEDPFISPSEFTEDGQYILDSIRVFDAQGDYSDYQMITSFEIDNSGPQVIEQLSELEVHQDQINFGESLNVTAPIRDRISGNTKYVRMVFGSETGSSELEINMNEYQQVGGNDVFTGTISLPSIGEGGLWSIKSLATEDQLGNITLLGKDDFSESAISSLSFRANNSPVGKATIIGSRRLGHTLTIDPTSIIDQDNSSGFSNYQSFWQIQDDNAEWQTIYSDNGLDSEYTLTEADANKFFRTLTTYTDGHGFSETVIGNEFQFTEHLDIYNDEDFENGAPGWVKGGNGQQATTSLILTWAECLA